MSSVNVELLKDLKKIQKTKLFLDDARATISFDFGDVTSLVVSILPVNGPFSSVLVRFRLKFSHYKRDKPEAKILTKIYHPNVSQSSGNVCFTLFGSDFKASYGLLDYVNGLVYFLLSPNPEDPLNRECAVRDIQQYTEKVQKASRGELGEKYENCHVSFPVPNSQELANIVPRIRAFFDRKTTTEGVRRAIDRFDKENNLKSSKSLKLCSEKMKLMLASLHQGSNVLSVKDFDTDGFFKLKNTFTSFLERTKSIQNMETKIRCRIDKYVDLVRKRCVPRKIRYYEKKAVKEFVESVKHRILLPIPNLKEMIFRQSEIEMKSLIRSLDDKEEEKEENGEEDLENSSEIFVKRVEEFLDFLDTLFHEEMRILSYMSRVYHRFEKEPNLTFDKFEQNEFKDLKQKSIDTLSHLPSFLPFSDSHNITRSYDHFRQLKSFREKCEEYFITHHVFSNLGTKFMEQEFEKRFQTQTGQNSSSSLLRKSKVLPQETMIRVKSKFQNEVFPKARKVLVEKLCKTNLNSGAFAWKLKRVSQEGQEFLEKCEEVLELESKFVQVIFDQNNGNNEFQEEDVELLKISKSLDALYPLLIVSSGLSKSKFVELDEMMRMVSEMIESVNKN